MGAAPAEGCRRTERNHAPERLEDVRAVARAVDQHRGLGVAALQQETAASDQQLRTEANQVSPYQRLLQQLGELGVAERNVRVARRVATNERSHSVSSRHDR